MWQDPRLWSIGRYLEFRFIEELVGVVEVAGRVGDAGANGQREEDQADKPGAVEVQMRVTHSGKKNQLV